MVPSLDRVSQETRHYVCLQRRESCSTGYTDLESSVLEGSWSALGSVAAPPCQRPFQNSSFQRVPQACLTQCKHAEDIMLLETGAVVRVLENRVHGDGPKPATDDAVRQPGMDVSRREMSQPIVQYSHSDLAQGRHLPYSGTSDCPSVGQPPRRIHLTSRHHSHFRVTQNVKLVGSHFSDSKKKNDDNVKRALPNKMTLSIFSFLGVDVPADVTSSISVSDKTPVAIFYFEPECVSQPDETIADDASSAVTPGAWSETQAESSVPRVCSGLLSSLSNLEDPRCAVPDTTFRSFVGQTATCRALPRKKTWKAVQSVTR